MNMENLFSYGRTLEEKNRLGDTRRLIIIPVFCVLTVFQLFFLGDVTAQVKPRSMFLPPEMPKSAAENRELLLNASPILKLIDQANRESPLAFVWQLNTDTLVKAKDVFRELIEFEGKGIIRKAMAIDTITLRKRTDADYDLRRDFLRHSIKMASYNISQQKGKPILVFAQDTSNEKLYFKVFLDKASKRILKIQNLSTGRFYLPVPFEGGTISM